MSYRDDVEALTERCEALARDASTAQKNLDEARHLLEEAQARRRLPVLENIHVAAPCSADWDKMTGDARARHCESCDKNVYNLSSMTRAEAEALLIAKEGKLCVRYYQRADGTIITADCPVGTKRRRRRRRIAVAAFGAMSALAAAASITRGGPIAPTMGAIAVATPVPPNVPDVVTAPPVDEPHVTMGEMVYVPPKKPVKHHKPTQPVETHPIMGKVSMSR
jgi:hypothetical protein